MSSISTIALSGMNAAARRLEVSASNVANVMSTGRLSNADGTVPAGAPRAYAPSELVQTGSAGGGTQTTVTTATPSTTGSTCTPRGLAAKWRTLAAPNASPSQEVVGQIIASYSFAANATVM